MHNKINPLCKSLHGPSALYPSHSLSGRLPPLIPRWPFIVEVALGAANQLPFGLGGPNDHQTLNHDALSCTRQDVNLKRSGKFGYVVGDAEITTQYVDGGKSV